VIILVHLGNNILDEALVRHIQPLLRRPNCIQKWSDDDEQTVDVDIILVNSHTVRNERLSRYPACPKLLLDTGLSGDEISTLMAMFKLSGVVSRNSNPALLIKALDAVVAGEMWISRDMVKFLLHDDDTNMQTYTSDPLSKREIEIVGCVCKGASNKEIASSLALSEQTVKVHLNRIFRKVNVTSRAKLIAATVHMIHREDCKSQSL